MGIVFLDLFKGSLGKKEGGGKPERKRGCRIEEFACGSLSEEEDLRTKGRYFMLINQFR